jgi:hypothetical protein
MPRSYGIMALLIRKEKEMEIKFEMSPEQVRDVAIKEVDVCFRLAKMGGDPDTIKAFETVLEMLMKTSPRRAK